MLQDLFDHFGVFDARDDLDMPATAFTFFDINVEDTPESLHLSMPLEGTGHGLAAFGYGLLLRTSLFRRFLTLASFCWCNQCPMLAVWCEDTVKPRQIHTRFRTRPARPRLRASQ